MGEMKEIFEIFGANCENISNLSKANLKSVEQQRAALEKSMYCI